MNAKQSKAAKKDAVILEIAKFLVDNQAGKGIALEAERIAPAPAHLPFPRWGQLWANMRSACDIHGYPTVEEAVRTLKEILE